MWKKTTNALLLIFCMFFLIPSITQAEERYVCTVGDYDYYANLDSTYTTMLRWRQVSNGVKQKQVWAYITHKHTQKTLHQPDIVGEVIFRYFSTSKGILGRELDASSGRIYKEGYIANNTLLNNFYNFIESYNQERDKARQQTVNNEANFKQSCQREQKEINRVYDLIGKRKFSEAKHVARSSINRLPGYSQSYIAYALACMEENNNYKAAINILSEGINNKAKEPSKSLKNIDATLYYYRAVFNLRTNNKQSARIDFSNVVDLHQGGKEEADAKQMCQALRPRV